MFSSRANAICLLHILQKYSDENHILPMREIQSKLKSSYGIEVDRRTVYATIELLQLLGYDISTYEENSIGYYMRSRIVESSELSLLIDAVYSFPFISAKQSMELIEKLKGIGSIYQGKRYRHLSITRSERKTENKQVFLNIELLDEAIEQARKVSFTYLTYNEEKQLVPRRKDPYVVNPYNTIYTNEHYYLVCTLDNYENESLYRIDRMRDLAITNEAATRRIETAESPQTAIYAFMGKPELVTFAFDKRILNDVIDRFGSSIELKSNGDKCLARIMASPRGIKFWALQYLPYVEVLTPRWLRDEIVSSIEQNPYIEK